VIDLSVGEEPGGLIKLVNPQIVEKEGEQREEEGCLSIPSVAGTPVRPARVTVKGWTPREGSASTPPPSCWPAPSATRSTTSTASLFVDRLTPLKRDLLKRKLRKKAKADDWDE
jgi:peptide deformylase